MAPPASTLSRFLMSSEGSFRIVVPHFSFWPRLTNQPAHLLHSLRTCVNLTLPNCLTNLFAFPKQRLLPSYVLRVNSHSHNVNFQVHFNDDFIKVSLFEETKSLLKTSQLYSTACSKPDFDHKTNHPAPMMISNETPR